MRLTSHIHTRTWPLSLIVLVVALAGGGHANKEGYYGKYIGKLSQLHHGVSGDVFAVDSRTLHLRNFNYDGEGPAAYFYAGNTKTPGANGFRLRDERGTQNVLPKYRNKHITITLPEGKTLQNIKWFSVWCDEFSVNFGDVKIPKNLDYPKPQKIDGLSGVHGVSSEPIVIVDAQTLLVPSFSYDGEAPDAKFWVGAGSQPSPRGIRIPDENGKEVPLRRYDRKTIVLTLPGDLTIFDIGHFGVWCEAFTVDFGHVQIPRGLNVPPSLKMLGVSPQKRSPIIDPPIAVQNGFETQFGSRHAIQTRVINPINNKDYNARAKTYEDVEPTTYKPQIFQTLTSSAFPNNNNNAFEIQKSISLPPHNDFVIKKFTGDFVEKYFNSEAERDRRINHEGAPTRKISHQSPKEVSDIHRGQIRLGQPYFEASRMSHSGVVGPGAPQEQFFFDPRWSGASHNVPQNQQQFSPFQGPTRQTFSLRPEASASNVDVANQRFVSVLDRPTFVASQNPAFDQFPIRNFPESSHLSRRF